MKTFSLANQRARNLSSFVVADDKHWNEKYSGNKLECKNWADGRISLQGAYTPKKAKCEVKLPWSSLASTLKSLLRDFKFSLKDKKGLLAQIFSGADKFLSKLTKTAVHV